MIGHEFGSIAAVLLALVLMGLGYNVAVAWSIREGYAEGFMWLAVLVGVLLTLGGVAVLNPTAALLAAICFAASGTPMAAGSIRRYVQQRKAAQKVLRERGLL